ncbi:DUF2510 domain-containing protein [Mycetocola zhadangensis]|uniref:DUF2510 domain-containing protein n=1 Tax=Mycetocola zhadangensis TaxID=1164595 RepID=UPI003A4E3F12
MSEQVPANWYPDGQGSERYWDGSAWAEHVRMFGEFTTMAENQTKKDGAFAKMVAAARKASADKQAAKDDVSKSTPRRSRPLAIWSRVPSLGLLRLRYMQGGTCASRQGRVMLWSLHA